MRKRKLDTWSIYTETSYQLPVIPIYRLQGRVIEESDGDRPECRLTITSPIISINENIVTTASGSSYELIDRSLDPNLSLESIRLNFTNPWIDGDNWKTR